MGLKKQINDLEIDCTPEEERLIRSYWDINIQYPEFSDAISFNHVDPHVINIERARQIQETLVRQLCDFKISWISESLDVAMENKNQEEVDRLLEDRKQLRSQKSIDFSQCSTLQELRDAIPEILLSDFQQLWRGEL